MVDFKTLTKKWNMKETITKVKDTRNFEVDKTGRFAARFFQFFLAIINFYWVSKQSDLVPKYSGLGSVYQATLTFSIFSPMFSVFLVLLYVFPWFSKKWTSRRMLSGETFCDLFMCLCFISLFSVWVTTVGGSCFSLASGDQCVAYNWFVTWMFLLFVSWGSSLWFDATAWYFGVFKGEDIESDVLLDIRRTTRNTSSRR